MEWNLGLQQREIAGLWQPRSQGSQEANSLSWLSLLICSCSPLAKSNWKANNKQVFCWVHTVWSLGDTESGEQGGEWIWTGKWNISSALNLHYESLSWNKGQHSLTKKTLFEPTVSFSFSLVLLNQGHSPCSNGPKYSGSIWSQFNWWKMIWRRCTKKGNHALACPV